MLCAHACWHDAHGTLCVSEEATTSFEVLGEAQVVGPSDVAAEAGIASIVLRIPAGSGGFELRAASTAGNVRSTAQIFWTAAPLRAAKAS